MLFLAIDDPARIAFTAMMSRLKSSAHDLLTAHS